MDRREQMLHRISRCALRLAADHGFDGFTMEDLAEEVGVSRRTLFNYVPGKMDAVLGPDHPPSPQLFDTFLAGGPTGEFAADLKALALNVLERKDVSSQDLARFRRLVRTDARVMHAVHDRFEQGIEYFIPLIQHRQGPPVSPQQARVAIHLVVSLCDVALDEYIEHPSTSFGDHFASLYDAMVQLMR